MIFCLVNKDIVFLNFCFISLVDVLVYLIKK